MDVKLGQKKYEFIGLPDGWTSKTLGEVVDFSGGAQPPRSTFVFGAKKGYIRLIQIRDYKSDNFATYIPELMAHRRCSSEDIMIGRYGPPIFQILRGIEGAYNVALLKASPTPSIDREFLYYVLRQDNLFFFIEALSQRSSGQTGVEMPALKGYEIALPPLPEQRAIAAALSDTDALLSSLDRLLTKKRDIKQAVMQQLLTGKQRLPGFSGEWEVKRLGEIASMGSGGTPPSKIASYYGGDLPWVSVADMTSRGKYVSKTERNLTLQGLQNSSAQLFPIGTILYAMYASIGECSIATAEVCTSQAILGIRVGERINGDFLYFYLVSKKAQVKEMGQQGTQSNINKGMVENFEISLPSYAEQTAIAAVLSDMDAEIDALQERRDKTRAVKQGMMQELLTGRTRLV